MEGPTHHLLGAAAGLALASGLHWSPLRTGIAIVLAAAVAGGPLSPDLDQSWGWRKADRLAPDEALGYGGPMRHRGITHWWGLPASVLALVPLVTPDVRWAVLALLAGWCSHLAGDFVFGKRDVRSHRHAGIPLYPWWGHIGIGLDTGGSLELLTRSLVLPVLLAVQALYALHWIRPISSFIRGLLPT